MIQFNRLAIRRIDTLTIGKFVTTKKPQVFSTVVEATDRGIT